MPLHRHHRLVRPSRQAAVAVAFVALATTIGSSGQSSAHNTIVFDEAGESAPQIGLIGDSTLAGVRWWGSYGDLRRYNFVLDAESCRRTLEESCWSREDLRPDTTVVALERLAGEWGEVLVVMSGYNDSSDMFDDAVDAVVAEARGQQIRRVIWLTLRTDDDVVYQDPQQRADVDGYREDNRVLYDKAADLGGYLQVADWATYARGRSDWFEYDGAHLSADGASALSTFIADSVDAVLAGDTLNPERPPWATLATGDSGSTVSEVQQALLDAGVTTVAEVDGEFGELTADAVAEFQARRGLDVTGVVDEATALALGVHGETTTAGAPRRPPPRTRPLPDAGASPPLSVVVDVSPDRPFGWPAALALAVAGFGGAGLMIANRRRRTPPAWSAEENSATDSGRGRDAVVPGMSQPPYDYEDEDVLVTR